jgi:hypothetical protein
MNVIDLVQSGVIGFLLGAWLFDLKKSTRDTKTYNHTRGDSPLTPCDKCKD